MRYLALNRLNYLRFELLQFNGGVSNFFVLTGKIP